MIIYKKIRYLCNNIILFKKILFTLDFNNSNNLYNRED